MQEKLEKTIFVQWKRIFSVQFLDLKKNKHILSILQFIAKPFSKPILINNLELYNYNFGIALKITS